MSRAFTNQKQADLAELGKLLHDILLHDINYEEREIKIYNALATARKCGLLAGIRSNIEDPEWPVVFIVLPEDKEVAWHMQAINRMYDGHTHKQKVERIEEFVKNTTLLCKLYIKNVATGRNRTSSSCFQNMNVTITPPRLYLFQINNIFTYY